jgi:predicted TPR repeat methyltransferase
MNRKERRAQGQTSKAPRSTAADPLALHEEGIQAFRTGQLGPAAELISRAIAACEPVPEFHYNLAIVLRAMGRLQDAALCYQRAIALKPDHVNAHNNLGNVWRALGRTAEARASFAQALHYHSGNADTHYSLGLLCCDEGEVDEARQHLRRCLECDPADRDGAGILMAHLGAGEAPARTPEAQLLSLYDVRSRFWDEESRYFAPALVGGALRRHALRPGLDILDIGCGTGLVGAAVRDLAARLDGADISPAMLEKAGAKRLYDGLFQADLAPFMAEHPGSYDAVLAAATLIHFGDLLPLFQAAHRCLRSEGLFIFTLFAQAAEDHGVASNARLAQSGCFAHSASYVARLAPEAGFAVAELAEVTHEHDQDDQPVAGLLAVLRRT